jgi:hypothetical protein
MLIDSMKDLAVSDIMYLTFLFTELPYFFYYLFCLSNTSDIPH